MPCSRKRPRTFFMRTPHKTCREKISQACWSIIYGLVLPFYFGQYCHPFVVNLKYPPGWAILRLRRNWTGILWNGTEKIPFPIIRQHPFPRQMEQRMWSIWYFRWFRRKRFKRHCPVWSFTAISQWPDPRENERCFIGFWNWLVQMIILKRIIEKERNPESMVSTEELVHLLPLRRWKRSFRLSWIFIMQLWMKKNMSERFDRDYCNWAYLKEKWHTFFEKTIFSWCEMKQLFSLQWSFLWNFIITKCFLYYISKGAYVRTTVEEPTGLYGHPLYWWMRRQAGLNCLKKDGYRPMPMASHERNSSPASWHWICRSGGCCGSVGIWQLLSRMCRWISVWGTIYRLGDLLYGLMLESYNWCGNTVAIAEHLWAVRGSICRFSMNEKAASIGLCGAVILLHQTVWIAQNEGGETHERTARDLALLLSYVHSKWNVSFDYTDTQYIRIEELDGKRTATRK